MTSLNIHQRVETSRSIFVIDSPVFSLALRGYEGDKEGRQAWIFLHSGARQLEPSVGEGAWAGYRPFSQQRYGYIGTQWPLITTQLSYAQSLTPRPVNTCGESEKKSVSSCVWLRWHELNLLLRNYMQHIRQET